MRQPTTLHWQGRALYGDDFTAEEIAEWFSDEADASFDLNNGRGSEESTWAEMTDYHLYSRIPHRKWRHVLSFGGATGVELRGLEAERGTIIESTDKWEVDSQVAFPIDYVIAQPTGDIALPDASVDLIVCLGVLHHIPNVSHVLAEFRRVLTPEGYLVMNEPIVSMGDFTKPRNGLTAHERGLPLAWAQRQFQASGFRIERSALTTFPGMRLIERVVKGPVWTKPWAIRIDAAACRALRPRLRYHAANKIQKVRPSSAAWILRPAR